MSPRDALLAFILAGAVATPARAQAPEPDPRALPPCDAAETDLWVTHLRDGVLQFDLLAKYAVQLYGAPIDCAGSVTAEFDGSEFGILRLRFEGGASFEIETQPPETSIARLRTPGGFADVEAARRMLEAYCDEIGVDIDWTVAETTVDGDERLVTYADPEEGLNAMASLIYRGETLVGLRFSLAL